MIAQCWLHIGTEKTGTTSIQNFFAQNRTALRARGWLYPRTPGIRAHHDLVAYSVDDEHDTGLGADADEKCLRHAFRHQLIETLGAEIAASGASTLVLSNERLATRLRQATEIARIKGLCDQLAQNTRVVVFLRNQVDFLASRYTNVVWEGGTDDFAFRARTALADYKLLLDRWSQAFGKENLVVRRFEPADFCDGDLIADFARTIGLELAGLDVPPRANPSLDAQSLAFLRGINRRLPHGLSDRVRPLRSAAVRVLQRRRGSKRFAISRAEAERIEAAYSESNARVADEYFGSRFRPLFSPAALVCKGDGPRRDRVGPFAAIRIAGFLAIGLLRDGLFWAARRLLRPV